MGCGCGGGSWTPPPNALEDRDPNAATGPGAPGYYHTAGDETATVVSEQGEARVQTVKKFTGR